MYSATKTIVRFLDSKLLTTLDETNSVKSSDKVKLLCINGHEFTRSLAEIYVQGKWCKDCNSAYNEENNVPRRLIYMVCSFLISDSFTCKDESFVLKSHRENAKLSVAFEGFGTRVDNSRHIVVTYTDFLAGFRKVFDVIIDGLISSEISLISANISKLKMEDQDIMRKFIHYIWNSKPAQPVVQMQAPLPNLAQIAKFNEIDREKEIYISKLEGEVVDLKNKLRESTESDANKISLLRCEIATMKAAQETAQAAQETAQAAQPTSEIIKKELRDLLNDDELPNKDLTDFNEIANLVREIEKKINTERLFESVVMPAESNDFLRLFQVSEPLVQDKIEP